MTEEPRSSRDMLVLVAPEAPPIGGITRWTHIVRGELLRQGIRLEVVNTSPGTRALDGRRWADRIFGGVANTVRTIFKTARVLDRAGRGVVHIATSGGLALVRDLAVFAVAASRGADVHLHIHHGRLGSGLTDGSIRGGEKWLMGRLAARVASLIVLDEKSRIAILSEWPVARVRVIPNPVIMPHEADPAEKAQRPTVLFLGWIIAAKGVEDLLRAWKVVAPEFPGWGLELVGGMAEGYHSHLVDSGLVGTSVAFLGELPHREAMQVLRRSEILVLPSHSEGFPNVVLEAMAAGVPVVASSVGAIPEMLSGGGGVLHPPANTVELGVALRKLMNDDAVRRSEGLRGAAVASRRYGVAEVVSAYKEIWGV